MNEEFDVVKYINDMAAGIFNILTTLDPTIKIGLYNGHKAVMDIGPTDNDVFSKFGYHKDGLDFVGLISKHREYLDWVKEEWEEDEIKLLEDELFNFVIEQMNESGFNDENMELDFHLCIDELELKGLEGATFLITLAQPLDWSNVDQFVLESALTKIIAVQTFITEFLNILVADVDDVDEDED